MKNAEISFLSVITSDGTEDKTEYTAYGSFSKEGDTVKVKYTEPAQSDMGEVETHLTVSNGEGKIERIGGVHMKMVISRGETLPAVYKTAYGELVLETRGIDAFWEEKDGGVTV